ncbi:MAG: hypothetical protein L0L99_00575 [Lacticaseibacillus paracasei]|nr:hypothetical protein [Lacticaseibacillus paracasei]
MTNQIFFDGILLLLTIGAITEITGVVKVIKAKRPTKGANSYQVVMLSAKMLKTFPEEMKRAQKVALLLRLNLFSLSACIGLLIAGIYQLNVYADPTVCRVSAWLTVIVTITLIYLSCQSYTISRHMMEKFFEISPSSKEDILPFSLEQGHRSFIGRITALFGLLIMEAAFVLMVIF